MMVIKTRQSGAAREAGLLAPPLQKRRNAGRWYQYRFAQGDTLKLPDRPIILMCNERRLLRRRPRTQDSFGRGYGLGSAVIRETE